VPNNIRAITFDFWGTLYANEPYPLEDGRTRLRAQRLGEYLHKGPHPLEQGDIGGPFVSCCQMFRDLRAQGEIIHSTDMILAFGDELGVEFCSEEIDDMTAIIEQVAVDVPPQPMPHATEVLGKLKKKYSLGIIADTGLTPGRILRDILSKDSMIDLFSTVSFSDETIHRKPNPEHFLQVLQALDVEADQAVHVGDLVENDVVGAKAVGMHAILLTTDELSSRDHGEADAVIDSLSQLPSILSKLSTKKHVYGAH
jgi:putative hydrolase of the HAD superfamily